MGTFTDAVWEPDLSLPGRANQKGGTYRYYTPDLLSTLSISIDPELSTYLSQVERRVQSLVGAEGIAELEDLSRFLLRSEAIASSQIEGIAPAARQIALAEIGEGEDVRGISDAAKLVARNMTVVREASQRLAFADKVQTADLIALQAALLGTDGSATGLRTVQNGIGTSNYHPIDAEYVPPAPHLVPELVEDLLSYLNGATHGPLVQAALVHAQFENIHPFTDGNGRVGRALIHTVLTRRGLTPSRVLPVSLVLSTFRTTYVSALNATHFEGAATEPENTAALNDWIRVFASAVDEAVTQAEKLREQIRELHKKWFAQLADYREQQGFTRALRSDSAVAQILPRLAGSPVLTIKTASDIHGLSPQKAHDALSQLNDAGIMTTRKISRGTNAYMANDVLDHITVSTREEGLAWLSD
ncbi:Fic family protein [Trueperella bialowiezensis]|uniref:Mobile mystery protein B n=1 Tax=Trueperella bialowiezensis TaxID=312285 RepID=A0A3S4VTN6_9ACTO|nr:Fic family protein [Trueperella bialowiezensis]VEI13479.1 mobile mystery protein B [Trueperella bialowiezensis]